MAITQVGAQTYYSGKDAILEYSRRQRAIAAATASTLNTQSTISEILRNVPADGRVIPLVYGRAQVGGQVFALDYTDGTWTVGYMVCLGEINSYQAVYLNEVAIDTDDVTIDYYYGTTSQTANTALSTAISGYTDTLVVSLPAGNIGVAYVVIQYDDGVFDAWPDLVVEIEGKKVWNPKTSTTVYSANPALHLGDLLSSDIYGHCYTVDDTALEAAQDYCDDATLGETRRESFTVMNNAQDTDAWVEILRTYAGCFVVLRGDTIHLVPDKAGTSAMTLTAADIVRDSLKIVKKDSAALPTVIRVSYTDTAGTVWRERLSDPAEAAGVAAGTTPRRESHVRLNGVSRHSQAYREAVERLNKLTLADLEVRWEMFDEALALEVGDIVTLTHPYGLTSKKLRLTGDPVQTSPGRWGIRALEYDPNAYNNDVVSEPTYTDGSLPDSGPPAAVSGLAVSETTYQLLNGDYASRLNMSWTASTNSFVTGYSVQVLDGVTVVWATSTALTSVSTSPLTEAVNYTVKVFAQTALYIGTAAQDNHTIVGKTGIPDPPASVSGFEVGGEVRLTWPASTDIDATRYEVRYSTTVQTWSDGIVIDIVDGLRLITKDVPEGTWRFHVKTIDSIRQESTTAATIDLTVTLDDNAFAAGSLDPVDYASGTALHSAVEVRGSGITAYYSDGSDTWTSMFPNAMSTYTNAVASYQSTPASEFLSEELTLDADASGNWRGEITYTDISGTATAQLGLKPDAGSYTYGNLSQQGTARYARLRLQAGAGDVMKVEAPSGLIRADVAAREEVGTDTSSSSAAKTITLSREYSSVRSISVLPEGTSALTAVYDNIVLDNGSGFTEFDVYIFNDAGTQVANAFRWSFKGV